VKGAAGAGAGGVGTLIEPINEAIDVITGQQESLSGASTVQMVLGAIIVVGALVTLYARWDDSREKG
jgi:hypothetical protein